MPNTKASQNQNLAGLRVLIVEDELLVAMDYEEMLRHAGCVVIGPVARQAKALALLERGPPDVAVLDLNLAGERSTPLAEALAARGVPFVIVTGYSEKTPGDPVLAGAPRLAKPVRPKELVQAIAAIARAN